MLYSCSPPASRGAALAAGQPSRPVRRRTRFTVDIHCHVFTPEAEEIVRQAGEAGADLKATFSSDATREVNRRQRDTIRGKLTSVAERLADMDAMGIDIQAI